MTHAWCSDPARDEAVRAAEDNRQGPLPTLEEAIARAGQFMLSEAPQQRKCTERESVRERRPPEPGVGGNVTGFDEPAKCSPAVSEPGERQSGMRTERVVLEVTMPASHQQLHPKVWPWKSMLSKWGFGYSPGESVRVFEEDARSITQNLAADRFASAVAEADRLKARVAELESAPAARHLYDIGHEISHSMVLYSDQDKCSLEMKFRSFSDGRAFHDAMVKFFTAAPAASVAANSSGSPESSEPDAWGVRRKGGVDAVVHRLFRSSAEQSAEQYGGTVVPLYTAPPPARGWLTAEEREELDYLCPENPNHAVSVGMRSKKILRGLLARSSQPLPPGPEANG